MSFPRYDGSSYQFQSQAALRSSRLIAPKGRYQAFQLCRNATASSYAHGKRLSNSLPEGNGAGFKLRTLPVQKNIRGLQVGDLRLDFGHLACGQGCALRAIDRIAPLRREDIPDLSEWKTHVAGTLNELQIGNGLIAVGALVVGLPMWRDKPELFLIASLLNTAGAVRL